MSACALTGHRVLGKGFSRERLEQCLRALIAEGADTFYCGMALGFDLYCCELLLRLREEFPVRIVACVPCADQAARYSPRAKEKYEALLSACDEKIVLHEKYENGCMFERNRYMVDHADFIIAVWDGRPSGTGKTVTYARGRNGKSIIVIDPVTLAIERL